MNVYVVTEEVNGFNEGYPDLSIVAVFATEAQAKADVATREQAARAEGKDVYGEHEADDEEWEVAYAVEMHEVTFPPALVSASRVEVAIAAYQGSRADTMVEVLSQVLAAVDAFDAAVKGATAPAAADAQVS